MNLKPIFSILAMMIFLAGLVSCDEIQGLDQSKDGEIVWVGNGLETPYRLSQNSGVVVDFKSESDSTRSFFVDDNGRKDFIVKDDADSETAKDEELGGLNAPGIPAKLEWAEKSEQFGKLLELKFSENASSAAYEVLKDGKLALRASLQALWDRDLKIDPIFLEGGEILFVNQSSELVVMSINGIQVLSSNVVSMKALEHKAEFPVASVEKNSNHYPIAIFENSNLKSFKLWNDFQMDEISNPENQSASIDAGGNKPDMTLPKEKIDFCIGTAGLCYQKKVPEGWILVGSSFDPYRSSLIVAFNSADEENTQSMLWIIPSTVFEETDPDASRENPLTQPSDQTVKFIYPELIDGLRMFDLQALGSDSK